jgi:hypothetical protein
MTSEYEIVSAEISNDLNMTNGIVIEWSAKHPKIPFPTFGLVTFNVDTNDNFVVDDEYMGKDFAMQVLKKVLSK